MRELTPELQKRLLGALPIDESASIKVVPQSFNIEGLEEIYWPKFYLKSYTNEEKTNASELWDRIEGKPVKDFEKEIKDTVYNKIEKWEIPQIPTMENLPKTREALDKLPSSYSVDIFVQSLRMSGYLAAEKINKPESAPIENDEANEKALD